MSWRHIFLFVALFFLIADNAHAYVDPGTGSIVFQALVATVLGGALTVKLLFRRFRGSLKQKAKGEHADAGKK